MRGMFNSCLLSFRQNLGRPGIPGSKDLDTALKRLSLRRQNERAEEERLSRERDLLDKEVYQATAAVSDKQSDKQEEMYVYHCNSRASRAKLYFTICECF